MRVNPAIERYWVRHRAGGWLIGALWARGMFGAGAELGPREGQCPKVRLTGSADSKSEEVSDSTLESLNAVLRGAGKPLKMS